MEVNIHHIAKELKIADMMKTDMVAMEQLKSILENNEIHIPEEEFNLMVKECKRKSSRMVNYRELFMKMYI